MAKTFVFERFDYVHGHIVGARDGEYVVAEEAINREAVNADRIRTLETQLKSSRAEVARLVEAMRDLSK